MYIVHVHVIYKWLEAVLEVNYLFMLLEYLCKADEYISLCIQVHVLYMYMYMYVHVDVHYMNIQVHVHVHVCTHKSITHILLYM